MSVREAVPAGLNEDQCWRAIVERRAASSGLFVVAVRTTGIFCRPGCPAKLPKRENVTFFASARTAASSGFRACKRCRPEQHLAPDADLVRRICRRLDASDTAPSLDDLAAEFGISKFHLQRTFKRVAGISPKQYVLARRVGSLKRGLRNGNGVAAAGYDAGFGSSRALYEQSPERLGMTPAAYRHGGAGMRLAFTIVTSAFGRMLVAATERGVSAVSFGDDDGAMERTLREEYHAAEIARDDASMRKWVDGVLRVVNGDEPNTRLPLDIRATAFRARVWDALRRIPRGETRTYSDIAREIGEPKAARAVGNACKTNPVAVVIPCHRVVREDGGLGGYAYGLDRKKKLLEREGAAS